MLSCFPLPASYCPCVSISDSLTSALILLLFFSHLSLYLLLLRTSVLVRLVILHHSHHSLLTTFFPLCKFQISSCVHLPISQHLLTLIITSPVDVRYEHTNTFSYGPVDCASCSSSCSQTFQNLEATLNKPYGGKGRLTNGTCFRSVPRFGRFIGFQ